MSSAIRLDWERLVATVRGGQFEPKDSAGDTIFLYSQARNVFVSDPYLVKQIEYARKHKNPFMLIGEFGTGKNIFLELVAMGNPSDGPLECIDENIDGMQDEMSEKFFGANNLVEKHPNSLFHFDLLQNAINWPVFCDKLHELARRDILYRTDGKIIRNLNIRVVGGATMELDKIIGGGDAVTSAKYLYSFLSTNQLARTRKLIDQLGRIDIVLSEILATQVLDPRSHVSENDIRTIEYISERQISMLKEYDWPDGFYELVRFVRNSLIEKRWVVDSLKFIPKEKLKVFISHSSHDLDKVRAIYDWLVDHNADPWISTEKLLPGQVWELEINKAIQAADLVIICLTKGAIGKGGFIQTEIKRALDLVERRPEEEIYLIPLRLEQCEPPLRISRYQYVDFFDPKGQNKLLLALRNRATTLGKAAVGPRNYLESR